MHRTGKNGVGLSVQVKVFSLVSKGSQFHSLRFFEFQAAWP